MSVHAGLVARNTTVLASTTKCRARTVWLVVHSSSTEKHERFVAQRIHGMRPAYLRLPMLLIEICSGSPRVRATRAFHGISYATGRTAPMMWLI